MIHNQYGKIQTTKNPSHCSKTCSRQTTFLDGYLNEAEPSEAAFEDQRTALQFNLKSLRENLHLISSTLMDLPETDYEDAAKDLKTHELDLEKREAAAAKIKNTFDTLMNAKTKANSTRSAEKETEVANETPKSKPKFKPKDLCIPKWEGDIVNYNA